MTQRKLHAVEDELMQLEPLAKPVLEIRSVSPVSCPFLPYPHYTFPFAAANKRNGTDSMQLL